MKVAIITDQHIGARKNSKLFHDYFLKFYEDVFFPYLEESGISVVVDMGDTFDSRKGIDFSALTWAKSHYFDRLKDMGITVHTIVGNHTAYYKNTNDVNAVNLLLREYENVKVYSETTEVELGGLNTLFIPWINQENEKETCQRIEKTSCKVAMGHLELNGFRVNKQIVMDHGHASELYSKFSKVYSGHYHTRSNDGRIFYLGNPYELFWTDVGDSRGFTIFDTKTLEHFHIDNPYRLFHIIYYEDTDYQTFDAREYENKIVKVIVRKKTNTKKFEKFIDKLYAVGIAELKVSENFEFGGWYGDDEFDALESEDTISILNRYIEEAEASTCDLDKTIVQKIIQEIYQEACELV